MDRAYVLAGCLILLFAGFIGADSISSTIICDGAAFVSSSVMGQGQTYAASLFTTHLSSLFRDIQVRNGDVKTRVVAESSGPMGIDEFSGRAANNTWRKEGCVFQIMKTGQKHGRDNAHRADEERDICLCQGYKARRCII